MRQLMAIVPTALGTHATKDPVDIGQLVWHLNRGAGHVRRLAAQLVGPDLAAASDIDPTSVVMDNEGVAAWVCG